jgi:hypothetical protein
VLVITNSSAAIKKLSAGRDDGILQVTIYVLQMAFYCDAGPLNTFYFMQAGPDGSLGLSVRTKTGWRNGLIKVADEAMLKRLNLILRQYSIDDLKQMSGNAYLNSTVYSMNVWFTDSS